jgi:hypothetical protein
MGLILRASCGRCGLARGGLKVGATTAQMSGERRSALHLFACGPCKDVAQVELFLGEPRVPVPCDRCGEALSLAPASELRVTTLSGERLAGHACPRCGERALSFEKTGSFL